MEIWLVISDDKHADPEYKAFRSKHEAVRYAKKEAKDCAKHYGQPPQVEDYDHWEYYAGIEDAFYVAVEKIELK